MQSGTLDTSPLSPRQFVRANALLDELLDLREEQRIDALRQRAVDDPLVAAAVECWLDAVHASAIRLRKDLEKAARIHNMGRILWYS